MKKLLSLMLIFVMMFALIACDNKDDDDDDDDKFSPEVAQKNAEDMGYVAESDPTSAEAISSFEAMVSSTLVDAKGILSEMTDDEIAAAFGEENVESLKGLINAEIKGGFTFAGVYENLDDEEIMIVECKNKEDVEVIKALFSVEGQVIVKDNVVVVSTDNISNLVINGAEKVESLNGKGPEQLYQDAYNSISDETKIKVITTQEMIMRLSAFGASDQTITQEVTSIIDGDDQYGYIYSEVNGAQEFWYVDGIYYLIANGSKLKGELDLDAYAQELGYEDAKQGLINVPSDWFKGVELKQVNDTYFMVITVSGEKYTELVGNVMGDQLASLGMSVEVGDVAYKVYLDKDGNIENIIADYQIFMTAEGQKITVDVYQTTELEEVGTATVTAPSNASSFTEVDWEELLHQAN